MKKIPLALALALTMTACGMMGKKTDQSNTSGATSASTSSGSNPSTSDTGGEKVERPEPTAAQTAALEGGQNVNWDQQGITWTLPPNWKKQNVETLMFNYGSSDGAFLIVNISPMSDDFPTDISTKASYDQGKTRKKNGEIDQLRYLEIDGLKGVQWRESPEKPDDIKRLQWQAYRKYAGQTQLVNLILSTSNKNFAKHQDEFYAILYSMKLVH